MWHLGKGKWKPEGIRATVCVDSYENGNPVGRFCRGYGQQEAFGSLSQFLIRMEEELEILQNPQSYTTPRTFSSSLQPSGGMEHPLPHRRGEKATFQIRILFRRNSSWQGLVRWQDTQQEQSFRSVLELILLMDSALRTMEGSGVA